MSDKPVGTCDTRRVHDGSKPHEQMNTCAMWRESAQPSPTVTPLCCPHGIAIDHGFACAKCEQNMAVVQPEGEPRPAISQETLLKIEARLLDRLSRIRAKLAKFGGAAPAEGLGAEKWHRTNPCPKCGSTLIHKICSKALDREQFEKWYGNRPANRREVSWEVWQASARQVRLEGEHAHEAEIDQLCGDIKAIQHDYTDAAKANRKLEAEVDSLTAERDALREACEQLQVQLAGCGVAALGGINDTAKKGDYGWSASYQDVLDMRLKLERAESALREAGPKTDENGVLWWYGIGYTSCFHRNQDVREVRGKALEEAAGKLKELKQNWNDLSAAAQAITYSIEAILALKSEDVRTEGEV